MSMPRYSSEGSSFSYAMILYATHAYAFAARHVTFPPPRFYPFCFSYCLPDRCYAPKSCIKPVREAHWQLKG